MKKIFLLCFFATYIVAGKSQTLKKTYYDIFNNVKMEEYYVNSKGEKNGKYKKYNTEGIIEEEALFKNGILNGTRIVYGTASIINGNIVSKHRISQKETYKDGLLNGPFEVYDLNDVLIKHGNYLNDEREGIWTFIEPYQNDDVSEIPEGFKYFKNQVNYKNGKPILEGKLIKNFYPSGKLFSEVNYYSGEKEGEETEYYPNGNLRARLLHQGGYVASTETWFESGKQKFIEKWSDNHNLLQREEFNEKGESLTAIREKEFQKEKEKKDKKDREFKLLEQRDEINRLISHAYSEMNNNISSAKKTYLKAKEYNDTSKAIVKSLEKLGSKIQIIDDQKEVVNLEKKLMQAKTNALSKYCEIQRMSNGDCQVIKVTNKKILYQKLLVDLYENLYHDYSSESIDSEKIKKGNFLLNMLETTIQLAEQENTKELEKALKKEEDLNKIKGLINL